MDSSTTVLIFVVVLCGVAILYCLFRVCGGRITDLLNCNLCRGPCCDCWGVGGRASRDEVDYVAGPPYNDYYASRDYRLPALTRLGRPNPIVIVNRTEQRSRSPSSSSSSSSRTSSSSSEEEGKRGRRPRRERRERTGRSGRSGRSGRPKADEAALYRRSDDGFRSEMTELGGGAWDTTIV